MGSCFSTCRPKRNPLGEEDNSNDYLNFLQDKLVISQSQAPKLTPYQQRNINKISPSPISPFSNSFYATTSTTDSSCVSSSSSLSTSESSSILKDRSFSNEFLMSCIKENPHISRINSIKECSLSLNKPQKRVRSSSPSCNTLHRQKSFRKEADHIQRHNSYSLRSSPISPSRRFDGSNNINNRGSFPNNNTFGKEICSKGVVGSYLSYRGVDFSPYYPSSMRKENTRPLRSSMMMNRETNINRVTSKIDEMAVAQALNHNDHSESSIPFEDIDNPLISMDCFIFI
ncbi:hypothetical protein ACFE04_025504 [Oxalis oulophora]